MVKYFFGLIMEVLFISHEKFMNVVIKQLRGIYKFSNVLVFDLLRFHVY